jgi:hypothetical protein
MLSLWVLYPFCVCACGLETKFIFGGGVLFRFGSCLDFGFLVVATIVVYTIDVHTYVTYFTLPTLGNGITLPTW